MSLKHYVEFFYPGIVVPEREVKPIENRKQEIVVPKGCYGYRFFDREEIEYNKEILRGERKNQSGTYYINGRKMSLKEVKEELPNENILIKNMEYNNYRYVVKTNRGQYIPYYRGDHVQSKANK